MRDTATESRTAAARVADLSEIFPHRPWSQDLLKSPIEFVMARAPGHADSPPHAPPPHGPSSCSRSGPNTRRPRLYTVAAQVGPK